jgi:pyrroline-5-carboxylate reductase
MALLNAKIGFVGGGNMGEAIIGALVQSEIFDAEMIVASDIRPESLEALHRKYGIAVQTDNIALFADCDIIVLAVKPQSMVSVLSEIAGDEHYGVVSKKLVISIAAGITIGKIESLLYSKLDDKDRKKLPIVRVMPNTPALVLSAMSGMSANNNCTDEDIHIARTILGAMGKVLECEEAHLDAVTAISGSGPAYVFYFMESMIQAGVELGLDPSAAVSLTTQTFKGAVALFEESGESAGVLRRKVTSPGGTTEAALRVFEDIDVKKNIIRGIHSAWNRSKELSSI